MKSTKLILLLLITSQLLMSNGWATTKDESKQTSEIISSEQEKYLLKFNPKVGKTGQLIMHIDMEIDMEILEQSMSSYQEMEMGSEMKVMSNTSEKVVTSMQYTYFAMSMDMPMMGTMEYDSRRKDNESFMAEAMDSSFSEILNSELIIEQSHDGTTLKTTGLDGENQLQTGQSNMDITSMMNMSQFPEKALKIGESWNRKIENETSPYSFDATYTLKKVVDGKVYVDLTSKVGMNELQVKDSETVETKMTGTQNGSFVYDQKSMWLLEANLTQDFEMETEEMGMTVPMKMKNNISMVMK
ncbi:MAG: DUF6263 family protein [Chitinophagales bacterium]